MMLSTGTIVYREYVIPFYANIVIGEFIMPIQYQLYMVDKIDLAKTLRRNYIRANQLVFRYHYRYIALYYLLCVQIVFATIGFYSAE